MAFSKKKVSKRLELPTGAVSVREYSRQMQCSDTSIRKAVLSEKIVKGVILGPKNEIVGIYPEIATQEWAVNRNPTYEDRPSSVPPPGLVNFIPKPKVETEEEEKNPHGSLAKIKQFDALYKAKMTEVKYREKIGELVKKKDVYDELFAMGQQIKSTFLVMPDRIIDDLRGFGTRAESYAFFCDHIAEALEGLSEINRMSTDAN